MPIKPIFFDALNRGPTDFEGFLSSSTEDVDFVRYRDVVVPLHYGNAEEEYRAIRSGCGLFDACMSTVYRVTGAGAGALLDTLCTRSISTSLPDRAMYTALCNSVGYVVDDAIAYKLAEREYLFMPTRLDTAIEIERRAAQSTGDVTVLDISHTLIGLFFQGPKSASVLHHVGFDGIETLKRFGVRRYEIEGFEVLVARIGYTGDLGYECWFDRAFAPALERRLGMARSLGFDPSATVLPRCSAAALRSA